MARPQKTGIDYFPLDVDIFDDDKLFDVQQEYGPLGEVIYMRLLCLIYKNGYYYKFDNLDKLASILIKSIGNRWARDKNAVKQVIPFLAKSNLFSLELMHENVLTSESIQRRFLKATERRQQNISDYWLLDSANGLLNVPISEITACNNRVNVYNNDEIVGNNYTKESKVNKSKVKDSKVNKTTPMDEQVINLYELYNNTCQSLVQVSTMPNPKRERLVIYLLEHYSITDITTVFSKANASAFLSGENKSKWIAGFDWIVVPENFCKILEGNYDSPASDKRESSYSLTEIEEVMLDSSFGGANDD